uniref:F-box domain-containing protein n=1 Tax=Kalanchoe fedtschenkoi TaxID=63787 RepID=A0A7N0VCH8_KALFE
MAGAESGDRISELPLSLRECILERIPVKEAVRTSILSRKWRYCWNGMTRLVFDEAFDDSMGHLSDAEFAGIIGRALSHHRGCIHTFVLHIPYEAEVDNLNLHAWFLILLRSGIQELAMDCNSDDGDRFTLPPHFFSCLRLTRISFEGAVLSPPPSFSGFPHLVTLDLKGALMCSEVLENLISKSPQLEKIRLSHARSSNQQAFVLSAPKLVTLELQESSPGYVILKNVPRLTSVSMMSLDCMALEFSKSYCPLRLMGSLSGVRELAFDFQYLETFSGSCPKSLPAKLANLTNLCLEWIDVWKLEELRFLFCFIRSSPSLQTLAIRVTLSRASVFSVFIM